MAHPHQLTTKEARLFRNNRSQAVRIPVEFELPGERVLISREGARLWQVMLDWPLQHGEAFV